MLLILNDRFMRLNHYYLAKCVPECQNGGVCSQPNICDCNGTGYMGDLCQLRMLLKLLLLMKITFLLLFYNVCLRVSEYIGICNQPKICDYVG